MSQNSKSQYTLKIYVEQIQDFQYHNDSDKTGEQYSRIGIIKALNSKFWSLDLKIVLSKPPLLVLY